MTKPKKTSVFDLFEKAILNLGCASESATDINGHKKARYPEYALMTAVIKQAAIDALHPDSYCNKHERKDAEYFFVDARLGPMAESMGVSAATIRGMFVNLKAAYAKHGKSIEVEPARPIVVRSGRRQKPVGEMRA